ncbi:hypothetical protein M8J76_011382 [Diaphorina citri]|nr:hypothetical protein M8J75_016201 [Diaphorina citri]KAI5745477.1 hypothetical protein M8J76_011382 [Diaphorina citri]
MKGAEREDKAKREREKQLFWYPLSSRKKHARCPRMRLEQETFHSDPTASNMPSTHHLKIGNFINTQYCRHLRIITCVKIGNFINNQYHRRSERSIHISNLSWNLEILERWKEKGSRRSSTLNYVRMSNYRAIHLNREIPASRSYMYIPLMYTYVSRSYLGAIDIEFHLASNASGQLVPSPNFAIDTLRLSLKQRFKEVTNELISRYRMTKIYCGLDFTDSIGQ